MARSPRIYTRTGDDGLTGLGDGSRTSKASARVAAYGTVDELNAALGVVLAGDLATELVDPLTRIQSELFVLGAELATPGRQSPDASTPQIEPAQIEALESLIDKLGADLPPLKNFILPGGDAAAAALHTARAICRRAERLLVELHEQTPIRPQMIIYLNRLSDALFVMARFQNKARGETDILWSSPA